MTGVTEEHDLVLKIGSQKAGGTDGQLIIEDVTFSGERDNTEYSGIGNEDTQAIGYGNKQYNLSFTQYFDGDGAGSQLLRDIDSDTQMSGFIRGPDNEINIGRMDWSSFDYEASDDGDVTLAVDMTVRNVDITDA